MRIRKMETFRRLAWFGVPLVSLVARTLRVQFDNRGQPTDPWDPALKDRYIYAIWHESLLGMLALRAAVPPKMRKLAAPGAAIISQSGHGELAKYLCEAVDVRAIRGSSTRGGAEVAQQVLASLANFHLLVAPDGPKGPRRVVKRGLCYLAAWSGKPIVPIGVGFSWGRRLRSWDQLCVPYPFSTVKIVAGPIVHVPAEISRLESDQFRARVEASLAQAQCDAALWAGERTLVASYSTSPAPRASHPTTSRAA